MPPRRIGRHISGGPDPEQTEEAAHREAVREAFGRWPSGVALVAVRAAARVHALTVSAFIPVSLDPPLVLVSLGPNAAAAPYLDEGTEFAISFLGADQRGLATRYADALPVGPSPFPADGPPVVRGALAGLVCRVDEILPRADHRLVIGAVLEVRPGPDGPALAWRRRDYRAVE